MSDIDIERVAALLSIVESAAKHSGKMGAISGAAMNELLQLNETLRVQQIKEGASRKAEADAAAAPQPKLENEDDISDTPSVRRNADLTEAKRRV